MKKYKYVKRRVIDSWLWFIFGVVVLVINVSMSVHLFLVHKELLGIHFFSLMGAACSLMVMFSASSVKRKRKNTSDDLNPLL